MYAGRGTGAGARMPRIRGIPFALYQGVVIPSGGGGGGGGGTEVTLVSSIRVRRVYAGGSGPAGRSQPAYQGLVAGVLRCRSHRGGRGPGPAPHRAGRA